MKWLSPATLRFVTSHATIASQSASCHLGRSNCECSANPSSRTWITSGRIVTAVPFLPTFFPRKSQRFDSACQMHEQRVLSESMTISRAIMWWARRWIAFVPRGKAPSPPETSEEVNRLIYDVGNRVSATQFRCDDTSQPHQSVQMQTKAELNLSHWDSSRVKVGLRPNPEVRSTPIVLQSVGPTNELNMR
jgi:hypothetical protein